MKKLLLLYFLSFPLYLFAQEHFTIRGKADNNSRENEKVYLVLVENGNEKIDSTIVDNGKFTFTGIHPTKCFAAIVGTSFQWQSGIIVLENGIIDVNITNELPVIGGTPLNDRLNSCEQKLNKLKKEWLEFVHEQPENINSEKELKLLSNQKLAIKDNVYDNLDNIIPAFYLHTNRELFCSDEIDSISVISSPDLLANTFMQNVVNSNVGKAFTNAILKDENNNDIQLSECFKKDKYLLLFYCKANGRFQPTSTRINDICTQLGYEKLIVIGVTNDNNILQSKKTIAPDQPPITRLSGDRYFMNLYCIDTALKFILFSPDGTIIARDFQMKRLKEILNRHVKNKLKKEII